MMNLQNVPILNMLTDTVNMPEGEKLPEIVVFAGPNGSGKSTITKLAKIIDPYVNADEIMEATHCSAMEAAVQAEKLREQLLSKKESFSFETVLSTDRNLNLLRRAKESGYFIRCIYILTADPKINIVRVKSRIENGGHSVPEEKIVSRYYKALTLLPQLISVCDIFHLYDNTSEPFRIFKKRKSAFYFWENKFWSKDDIQNLTGVTF